MIWDWVFEFIWQRIWNILNLVGLETKVNIQNRLSNWRIRVYLTNNTLGEKLPHFLVELSHCHFVTNYFDFWGREVSAYFSCPPLFEQNILFYDISFLFLTQMTPKTTVAQEWWLIYTQYQSHSSYGVHRPKVTSRKKQINWSKGTLHQMEKWPAQCR